MSDAVNCGRSHMRHWFTLRGHVGVRTPVCVRCGAENPKPLTSDDWRDLAKLAPQYLGDVPAILDSLENEDVP